MHRAVRALMVVPVIAITMACAANAVDRSPDEIVALERAALDRWGKGDPGGYLEIMATEVTYFDPTQEKRVDGRDAMQKMLAPITGKVRVDRFEMIDPTVQHHGDAALLTFNLVSYITQSDGRERAVARWNSSELYGRIDGQWRIVHSHWSYIKPELKQAVTEIQ